MKYLSIITLLLINFSIQAQESEQVFYTGILELGAFMEFENRSLHFKEVLVDSRCPKDVTCVRQGEAKVLVELFEKGKMVGEEILVVGQTDVLELFADLNLNIERLALLPYPAISKQTQPEDYQLQVEFSRSK